jgi:hypothetical protein
MVAASPVQRELARLAASWRARAISMSSASSSSRPARGWCASGAAAPATVTVLEEGYQFEERRYASLSHIAREVTGTSWSGPRFFGLREKGRPEPQAAHMRKGRSEPERVKAVRCAIYTRKSTEDGLEQEFNSLDAQREACAAYITSQRHEGWTLVPGDYDDGGFSGGTLERPALKRCWAK